MTFKLFKPSPSACNFSLSATRLCRRSGGPLPGHSDQGLEVNQIECEITRVLDDGTVSFKPTREGGLEQGVVYAVLVNKRKSPASR